MPKATIYIQVKNWELWKKLGEQPAKWVNKKLKEEFKEPEFNESTGRWSDSD